MLLDAHSRAAAQELGFASVEEAMQARLVVELLRGWRVLGVNNHILIYSDSGGDMEPLRAALVSAEQLHALLKPEAAEGGEAE